MKVNQFQSQHIQDMCQALRPVIGEQADKLWQSYIYADEESKEEIEETIELLALSNLRNDVTNTTPVFLPPSREEAQGEIEIGHVVYNGKILHPFGLKKSELFQHLSCFSRSGGGKTNLGFLILKSLARQNVPFLVLEWKRNYRDLLPFPEFQQLRVYTIGRNVAPFRFNPLIPPKGVDPKSYLKKLLFVLADSFLLGPGALYIFQCALDDVYQRAGVYNGTVKIYPTFHNVFEWIESFSRNLRGREMLWAASCLRTISCLCFGQIDDIINTNSNQDLEKLLQQQVIFEMDALSHTDKVFFIQALLLWIHDYRLTQPQREELVHAIFLEEAHHILPKHGKYLAGNESIIDVIFREIREYGEALLVYDQMPSEISKACLANSYCTIALNAKEKADVATLAGSMLLDDSQKNALGEMEIGKAIVKLQGRIMKPFMVHIPLVPVKKGIVTDEMLADKMKPYISIEPANLYDDLSDNEKELLRDIALLPNSGVAARYHRCGLSGRQGDKIKHLLLEKGYIQEQEVISDKGKSKALRLSEKGKKVLADIYGL